MSVHECEEGELPPTPPRDPPPPAVPRPPVSLSLAKPIVPLRTTAPLARKSSLLLSGDDRQPVQSAPSPPKPAVRALASFSIKGTASKRPEPPREQGADAVASTSTSTSERPAQVNVLEGTKARVSEEGSAERHETRRERDKEEGGDQDGAGRRRSRGDEIVWREGDRPEVRDEVESSLRRRSHGAEGESSHRRRRSRDEGVREEMDDRRRSREGGRDRDEDEHRQHAHPEQKRRHRVDLDHPDEQRGRRDLSSPRSFKSRSPEILRPAPPPRRAPEAYEDVSLRGDEARYDRAAQNSWDSDSRDSRWRQERPYRDDGFRKRVHAYSPEWKVGRDRKRSRSPARRNNHRSPSPPRRRPSPSGSRGPRQQLPPSTIPDQRSQRPGNGWGTGPSAAMDNRPDLRSVPSRHPPHSSVPLPLPSDKGARAALQGSQGGTGLRMGERTVDTRSATPPSTAPDTSNGLSAKAIESSGFVAPVAGRFGGSLPRPAPIVAPQREPVVPSASTSTSGGRPYDLKAPLQKPVSALGSQTSSRAPTPSSTVATPSSRRRRASSPVAFQSKRVSVAPGGHEGPLTTYFHRSPSPSSMKFSAPDPSRAPVVRSIAGSIHISEYELQDKLGEGTFGVVWRAVKKGEMKGKGKAGGQKPKAYALKQIILHNENDGVSRLARSGTGLTQGTDADHFSA